MSLSVNEIKQLYNCNDSPEYIINERVKHFEDKRKERLAIVLKVDYSN